MKAIVCVDDNWAIGSGNDLLYHIPEDMKFFKSKTIGNVVVMGMATFLSFPNQKPLVDRTNIVLSDDPDFNPDGVTVVRSMDELFTLLGRFEKDTVYVIGGASIYAQLVPYCTTVYVTKVKASQPADKFFPNLDKDENWILTKQGEELEYKGLKYSFTKYTNVEN